MKRKSIFGFGVLIFMISTGVLLMACPHGNGPGEEPPVSDLEVKPTAEADPALAGTRWECSEISETFRFADKGNIARFITYVVLYSIDDSTISFDMSKSLAILKNITLDSYIKNYRQELKKHIADLKKAIEQESNHGKKKQLEDDLSRSKKELNDLMTNDEFKKELEEVVNDLHKMSAALEPHAKFSGTLNADKTKLTIENLPVYDRHIDKVNKVRAVFTK